MGTRPDAFTPRAMVANADHAVGQLLERVSQSKYWNETAVFMIEDDAQNGSDHVDARRTVGLLAGPFVERGVVDSTLYTTSSMLRTIERLLGQPPMTQYDAAAAPMYAAFTTQPDPRPYTALRPLWMRKTNLLPGAHRSPSTWRSMRSIRHRCVSSTRSSGAASRARTPPCRHRCIVSGLRPDSAGASAPMLTRWFQAR